MSNTIYEIYNQKVDDIINKYKSIFLGIDKNNIQIVRNTFIDNYQYIDKLKEVEYTIYTHFSNVEKKYINEIEKLNQRSWLEKSKIKNVLGLLKRTANFNDIIYITKNTLDDLYKDNDPFKLYKCLNIYIEQENMKHFRETLNVDSLTGIKFDSTDYIKGDYGLDFYLGNVLVRVGVINRKDNDVFLTTFEKENYEKSFSLLYFEDINNENLYSKFKNIKYMKLNTENNNKKISYSLAELRYIYEKEKLLYELDTQKERSITETKIIGRKRGYISIYYCMIILSWILAGYTFITLIKGVIK